MGASAISSLRCLSYHLLVYTSHSLTLTCESAQFTHLVPFVQRYCTYTRLNTYLQANRQHVAPSLPLTPSRPNLPNPRANLDQLQSPQPNELPLRHRPRNQQRNLQLRNLVGRLDLEHHQRKPSLRHPGRRIHDQQKGGRSNDPIEFLHLLRRGRSMDESRARAGCRVNNRVGVR